MPWEPLYTGMPRAALHVAASCIGRCVESSVASRVIFPFLEFNYKLSLLFLKQQQQQQQPDDDDDITTTINWGLTTFLFFYYYYY